MYIYNNMCCCFLWWQQQLVTRNSHLLFNVVRLITDEGCVHVDHSQFVAMSKFPVAQNVTELLSGHGELDG